MSMSKKGSRPISVDGTDYRWSFFENSGWNDVLVQVAHGRGRKLHVHVEWEQVPAQPNMPGPLITPAFVREAILTGLRDGWEPEQTGENFSLRCSRGKFAPEQSS